ncbi:mitogen-activated protein kinase kinase kinase 19 [Megalops cyprinoides]|uniref:mitogen-activated protein kinase kinase kinase 19 n=1 Tax=Megalops cyprinoides TaxID=118141 RepID=UPI001864FA7C|nr:mitogen-activated protein kinase kinase kinase 19 [Megalops cyprinoides]
MKGITEQHKIIENSGHPVGMSGEFAEAVLAGDLEEVGRQIEDGVFSREDVDRPHDKEGCTPLITACQRGLTRAVHFLLEWGADVTLCNHSNQSAVHVSQPALQGELLVAVARSLSPQAKLLHAAWQGDLHSLQHLLGQKDLVDVNTQNRDGLTPLMLAVRDVDLFEGLEAQMSWEYRPVEVVQELLGIHAALGVLDHRGRSALHYAAQVQSALRDELVHLLVESLSPQGPATLSLGYFDPEEPSTNSTHSPLVHSFLIQTSCSTEDLVGLSECASFSKSRKARDDQRISLCFQRAAVTLREMRQEYQELEERSSRRTSLPSLWDRSRRGDRPCPLDTGQGLLKTKGRSCLPSSPRPKTRSEPVPLSLPVPHPPLLSQSAPTLGEPLLDSGSLLRVRAHIHTRLGGSEPEAKIHDRKGSLPSLYPRPVRTPKLLAPLDRGEREGAALPGFKHPLPLKPITLLPLASVSKGKRGRLSRRGSRGSPGARGGSEESSSSSVSSQGSLDLEEDGEHAGTLASQPGGHTQEHSDTGARENLGLDLLHSVQSIAIDFNNTSTNYEAADSSEEQEIFGESMEDRTSVQSHAERTEYEPLAGDGETELTRILVSESSEEAYSGRAINSATCSELNNAEKERTVPEKVPCRGEPSKGETGAESRETSSSAPEKKRDSVTEITVSDNDGKDNSDMKQVGPPRVNISVYKPEIPSEEKNNLVKAPKIKEKGNSISFPTNQSFNILAHKDHSRFGRKLKSNQRSTTRPAQLKANVRKPPDLLVSGEATAKPCVTRTCTTKASQKTIAPPLQRNSSTDKFRPVRKRSSSDAESLNKLEALGRKQPLQRELKCTRQPKKPGSLVTPRAKSAVDFVTYSDMFQEINRGEGGPAIYEMFATPVYDNLRASTSCARVSPRQVQSAPPRKHQGHRTYKCLKPLDTNRQRKTQRQKSSSASSKHRKRSDVLSRGKSHKPSVREEEQENIVFISGLNWHIKTTKSEMTFSEEDRENACCTMLKEKEEEPILSVIEEVLSNNPSETPILHSTHEDKTPPSSPEPHNITDSQTLKDHLPLQDANKQGPVGEGSKNDYDCEKAGDVDDCESCSQSFPKQPKINTWTSGSSDRTVSLMFRKYLDVAGEGPLTDDLLRCLAEELISLEEKDANPHPDNGTSCKGGIRDVSQSETHHPLPEGITSPDRECSVLGSCTEDAIMWTKGEVLGRGAYGTVYCGLTSQGQLIAVKQVALDDSDPDTAAREYQRLQDEVELLKTLCHANIVGFLGTGLQDNVVSIFMEYVPGGSIASIIHRFGPLPEKVLALYTRQILEGVAYLHRNRVIHRDLKGNNVMLMPTGVVKLIDFGCARRLSCLSHSTSSSSELLRSVHGTPYWMAPEVINETGHGRKSDIWSVGCTVFEMATGRPPLAHMDKMAALFYIGARRGLMPALPGEFSEDARNFVQACLTSEQKDRPSAEELLRHPFIPQREKDSGLLLQD